MSSSDQRIEFKPLRALRRHLGVTKQRAGAMPRKQKVALAAGTAAALLGLGILSPVVWLQFNKLPDVRSLESFTPVQAVRIFDRFDRPVAVVSGAEDRRPIKLSQVSPQMRLAMIGAEDHDFYHHGGINPSSIMRAVIVNLQAGRIVEGGSTITQQLVKNLFFPGEKRTFNRKIKEFFLANDVDKRYSKDQILEMYLNQIYFGNQSYGIEAAAQRYFTKPAAALTLSESAFLAGLVRSPSYLSNPEHRRQAHERQDQVLDQMAQYGLITAAQAEGAKGQKLAFRKFVNPFQKFPYYVSYVMDELRDHYGEQEIAHGLNVYTCLDTQAQEQAEKAMNDGIAHAPTGVKQGALVSLKVNDAGVIALVGGVGKFEDHQWNRAVSPHTMGSAFKPFVYLTGFLKGLTPESIVPDEPFSVPSGGQSYSPRNFDNSFMGPLTIKKALTYSRNVCAVRVAWFTGINNVINTAHLAGITSRLDPYLPTAVGACAASPLEMAGAYSTIARGGVYLTPHLVRRITSPEGRVIYAYDEKPHKVFDSNAVANLVECMRNVVEAGTGIYAKLPGRPVAGKTGTADKARDIWFVGFTPDTCTATWGGNDHNQAVGNRAVTGGMVMAGMWKKYMTAYYDTHAIPPGQFMLPSRDVTAVAMGAELMDEAKAKGILPVGVEIAGGEQKPADQEQKAAAEPSAEQARVASQERELTHAAVMDEHGITDLTGAREQARKTFASPVDEPSAATAAASEGMDAGNSAAEPSALPEAADRPAVAHDDDVPRPQATAPPVPAPAAPAATRQQSAPVPTPQAASESNDDHE